MSLQDIVICWRRHPIRKDQGDVGGVAGLLVVVDGGGVFSASTGLAGSGSGLGAAATGGGGGGGASGLAAAWAGSSRKLVSSSDRSSSPQLPMKTPPSRGSARTPGASEAGNRIGQALAQRSLLFNQFIRMAIGTDAYQLLRGVKLVPQHGEHVHAGVRLALQQRQDIAPRGF